MSDDNMLSQEEIDALMNSKQNEDNGPDNNEDGPVNDELVNLSDEEKDVIGEVNNIAMGSAATALYTILDQKVEITAPQVELTSFEEITDEYDRPCVLVKVEYVEGLEGVNLLIIKERDAAIIADLMMGGDGKDLDEELSEMHTSAVGEAMNQMMGSASTSLSSIIDGVVNISPPKAEYLNLNDVLAEKDEYFSPNTTLVATSFNLKIGDLVDSRFKQLAPYDFTKKLVATLTGEDSGGLTAKDNNKQQEKVSAVTEDRSSGQKKEDKKKEKTVSESNSAESSKKSSVGFAEGNSAQDKNRNERRQPSPNKSHGSNKVEQEKEVAVQSAQFPDFDQDSAQPLPQNMELIKDVPLQVTVRLGKAEKKIRDILELGEGSIVELDKLAGEPVDLLVNGKLVAKGEVVVIDENFGFRVKDIISPMERINNI